MSRAFDPLRIALAVLLLAAAWWLVQATRSPNRGLFGERLATILRQADLQPAGGTLVIGDSIVAANRLPVLCGRPALNAGIEWSTAHDWAPHVDELVRRARPALVILALGNNDTRSDWRQDYRRIARHARIAVTPKQPEKAAFIRTLLPSVAVPADTIDGTHLTSRGAREWTRRVEAKCKELGG